MIPQHPQWWEGLAWWARWWELRRLRRRFRKAVLDPRLVVLNDDGTTTVVRAPSTQEER